MVSPFAKGPVYVPAPINRSHPLNRGRVAWWLCLPGRMAGFTFYDIAGQNPGTLTSMGNANNGWQGSTRSGASGALRFAGSAGYVTTPHSSTLTTLTFGAWAKFTSVTLGANSYNALMTRGYNGSNIPWSLDLANDSNTGGITLLRASTYNGSTAPQATVAASTLSANQWYRILGQYDGTNWNLFVNGSKVGTTVSFAPPINTKPLLIGALDLNGSISRYLSGSLDDICVWNRALTAAEVQADYLLSASGYPGVLNRWASSYQPNYSTRLFFRRVPNDSRIGSRAVA